MSASRGWNPARRRDRVHPRRAFTLVEAAVSIVIVGVMLVAALQTVAAAADARRRGAALSRADDLARVLLAEILAKPYQDLNGAPGFGPEAGETAVGPRLFDDVDDYNDFSQSEPTDAAGVRLAGYSGWSWRVAVTPVQVGIGSVDALASWSVGAGGAGDGARLIAVTVRAPDGRATTVETLRSRWGRTDSAPSASVRDAAAVRVHLAVGEGAIDVSRSGVMVNVPEVP